ncbi:MAG: Acetylornithine aminotransferase [Candidatus Gottesmanbacteria bacterium GW2011_GWC2_39_8]|uniref:Acetylornithine aminotransferase n=1 Tax=Candidatus Gottesmanbacteria bacterium GW2011_GWC2_39_8 TaxID=1618450 RepID=A0A0G0T1B8_9BACT|nr:MAG: Acetylornithine aminotransferase [Candidatus Gottesmanbacteria bacterium GW2011_GWC2_39_8]
MKDFGFLQQKFMVNTYPNRGLVLEKGDGVYLYDESGNKYLDMMSNYGVSIFGYNNLVINEALITQLNNLPTLHGSFNNSIRADASQMLVNRCGTNYHQVYWSNSGAEAIEAALKFAVLTTGKRKFIVCEHGYHGKTLGALSATDGDKYRSPFTPLLWEFTRISFNDTDALEEAVDENTAGFIVEPVQGEGGLTSGSEGYLTHAREICTKKNILLILDEIQSGTGRTGYFLASHEENVKADIVCLGKGLAGGIPVGATIVSEKVATKITKNIHTSTFGGNPLASAGVVAVLKLLDDKQLNHIREISDYFFTSLHQIKSPHVMSIRGKGLMIGVEISSGKRNEVLKKLQQEKILVIPAGENMVRFLPPYIIEREHADNLIDVLNKIFDK